MRNLLIALCLGISLLCAASIAAQTPCCGQKPSYTGVSFPGQVAVVTYEHDPASPYVLSVIDLSAITATNPPRNTNYTPPVYNNPAWTVTNLGGIFGVTLDENGNIYVAATTLYSSKSVGIGGGYGSVYKIANGTGAVSVLANLPSSPVGTLNAAGLGNIAYDCGSHTLFVTDLDNGLIYQLNRNTGATIAAWNHGVHLSPPIADDATKTYTPVGRRVFAVRVLNNTVYFSDWWENYNAPDAAHDNAIWSVPLNTSGIGFAGPEKLEVTMPPYTSNWSNPVTDINVGPGGTFLFSERSLYPSGGGISTGAHNSRTIESPGPPTWTPLQPTKFRNNLTAGYPDSSAGSADYDFAATGGLGVWTMADALNFPSPAIYGIQGTPASGGTTTNSVLIDVSGGTVNPNKTQLGSVDIPCPPCATLDAGISGPDHACQSPAQYCATGVPAGSALSWSVTGGAFTSAGPNCIKVTWNVNGPYSIAVTITQPNGCRTTITRTIGPCLVCCEATLKAIPGTITATSTPGHYTVNTALTAPGLIQRVSASIVSTTQNAPASCPSGPISSYIASAPTVGPFVSFLPPFWREVKWTTSPAGAPVSNMNFPFEIVVPPLIGDCYDGITFCVRWELTDSNCRVCEITTCYRLQRGEP